jgi:ribosomal protein S18 acetylase RimI-like enzyme
VYELALHGSIIRRLKAMIQDFLMCNTLKLRHSGSESRRFGFEVARLLVPAGSAFSDEDITTQLRASTSTLVILRAESARTSLSASLKSLVEFDVLHADTLVYYRWKTHSSMKSEEIRDEFHVVDNPSWLDVNSVLTESFSEYRNHYSANSRLSSNVTLSGYQEWASGLMQKSETLTLVAHDGSQAAGFVLLTIDRTEGLAEIALNAVRPSSQRGGMYSALMREARRRMTALGNIREIYISTQSDNQAVIGAWVKLGLTPVLSLNTFHLMRRSAFTDEGVQ